MLMKLLKTVSDFYFRKFTNGPDFRRTISNVGPPSACDAHSVRKGIITHGWLNVEPLYLGQHRRYPLTADGGPTSACYLGGCLGAGDGRGNTEQDVPNFTYCSIKEIPGRSTRGCMPQQTRRVSVCADREREVGVL